VRLRADGFDEDTINLCEQALVRQEGFYRQTDFAHMPTSELTATYLGSVGIAGRGVQLRLAALHKEVREEVREEEVYKEVQQQAHKRARTSTTTPGDL
jgi:hypothetical protein